MIYKYFKNGNIHIKYECDIDDYRLHHTVNPELCTEPPTYADMIVTIHNSMLDCVDYENYDCYFSTIAIINHANDKTYDYVIPYDKVDYFFSGKWVILYGHDEHAYIKIPPYVGYGTYVDSSGHKFTYYKLEEIPDNEFMEEMSYHGCMFRKVGPIYAPEIKYMAMFVPYGKRVRYE